MSDYDFYLRDGSVHNGEWAGFPVAWKGRARLESLPARPYRRWYPWILDPAHPDDPVMGHRGVLQWRFTVALADGLAGLQGTLPDDGRSAAQIRGDLLLFMPLERFYLLDIDGTEYQVKMTAYTEQAIAPFDGGNPGGAMLAEVEFAAI